MFKIINSINKENVVTIQGAVHRDPTIPTATLLFQNYDSDTRTTYNMASVSCYDHYANELKNGMGDLVLRTKDESDSNPVERMRVFHSGQVRIGTNLTSSNSLLNVGGNLTVDSNIEAQELTLGRLTATTSRIILKASNISDGVINLNSIDASKITGTLSSNVFPVNVSFSNISSSNINTNTVNTTKLLFSSGQHSSVVMSNNSDIISYYKDWTDWVPVISSSINFSISSFPLSRYTVLNNTVTTDFQLMFNVVNSNLTSISFTLPLGLANKPSYCPQIIRRVNNDNLILSRSSSSSNNLTFMFQELQIGDYELAGQHTYVYI